MRVLFLGTPQFAIRSLEALLGGPDPVVAVVTQPDRPRGRGLEPAMTPVGRRALEAGIPCLKPDRLHERESLDRIRALAPDLAVTCAFGRILKPSLLEIPREGCLNVHASLLPRHRGASPISRAILEGDAWTGITIFRLDEGMDTGPLLLQRTTRVLPGDTTGSLSDRLADLGGAALIDALASIREGRARYIPQDEDRASYAPLLKKEDGTVSWSRPADQIERFVRAMDPWPGALTALRGQALRLLAVEPLDMLPAASMPGTLLGLDPFPVIAALPGRVRLTRVQPEGRRPMDADAWARGARLGARERLG